MRKRFLIVVGLPKSGTTFLYAQTARRSDRFAMPWGAKEVDYFRRGADLATYLRLFDGGETGSDGETRVYVDASPLYIDELDRSLTNMQAALAGHDVRIVVCLRDPLERAFSHYLHDVAQNQKIVGHADYSFWSPTVMAKYLFPLTPRVARLQEAFGAENVFGFAFGSDPGALETMLRDFAGLEPDWRLDLGDNPAPGFTSPQCWYNPVHDMEVPLEGTIYRLPAGHMLVVNRQFSLYRREMHRPLAEQIMMRQATLTRAFDTGMLREGTRARIYDDMRQAAGRLGLEMRLDPAPRVLQSKVSDQLPQSIREQLRPLCTLEQAVAGMFGEAGQGSTRTIAAMPHAGTSLARDMARLTLAHQKDPQEPVSVRDLQRKIIHDHGPIPHFIESMMAGEVARGNYDAALSLFDSYGGAKALLWPMDLAHFLKQRGITLPEDIAAKFRAAGVRVALPEAC